MTAHLLVDEIGVALHGTREGRMWWETFRARMPGRITTVEVRVPGDLVQVDCETLKDAKWLSDRIHAFGVPKRSLKCHETRTVLNGESE